MKYLLITILIGVIGFFIYTYYGERSFNDGIIAFRNGDNSKAFDIFSDYAEQGNVDAQYYVGHMNKNGLSVPQNYDEALKWYKLAADQGHVIAQNDLGMMYQLGQGTTIDLSKAFPLYQASAAQGYYGAEFNLGLMYYKGDGVEQSYDEAFKLMSQAAEQNFAIAQRYLGIMYKLGQGTYQNDIFSYMWLHIAKQNGDRQANEALSITATEMTPTNVVTAVNLANAWIEKFNKSL